MTETDERCWYLYEQVGRAASRPGIETLPMFWVPTVSTFIQSCPLWEKYIEDVELFVPTNKLFC